MTISEFVFIFWPMLIVDFVRSVGKSLFLLSIALYYKIRPTRFRNDFFPKASLIIPAHNEEKIIVNAIESALETDYPQKEIIVVDDGSKDKTFQLAYPYFQKGLIKLLHRDVASGSKATSLNFGLIFATGEIIVVVDADTLLERNALREIVKPLSDPDISAVSGNVRVLKGENGSNNLLVKLQAYEYLISLELGRRFNSIMKTLLIISGAFGAFWKESVYSIGEYDKDTITEDFDMSFKMRKLGKKLYFEDKAISWTFAPESWKNWRRQRIRWTKGQAETLWKHRNVMFKKGFDVRFFMAFFDMLFMDIILLFMRFGWFNYMLFTYQTRFIYILIFSFMIYMVFEFITIFTAGVLSPRKKDLKKIYLVPVVVLFYRPYYALIRLKAYFDWMLKKKSQW
ncbi:glycosyltransferase family 2 protein [Candidatus Bathyarchaeota archaeon]|nr:glycosyltransferase family 2 protein [Candidatus Bathyarchaeota archaeon]